MKDTYLKLLVEHIKDVRKIERRLLKDFKDNGGEIGALREECGTGYYWNETAQKCVLDVGAPE